MAKRAPLRLHWTVRPGKKSPIECARFLPNRMRLLPGLMAGDLNLGRSPSEDGDTRATNIVIVVRIRVSDIDRPAWTEWTPRHCARPTRPTNATTTQQYHDLSMLAADASNDGTMLGHKIVKRDCRVRLEDIRRLFIMRSYWKKMDGQGRRRNRL